ncbi:MAG: superoxide dismutase [Verrucomicrobiales bacterium]|nr:superoxide dismutase [Verrucomicrobiales bacterium]
MMTRRKALKTTVGSAMALSLLPQTSTVLSAQPAATAPAATGPFSLAKLPYAYDALEPHIDARTMEIHHSKHHASYVTNLNKAVAGKPELLGTVGEDQNKALEELIRGLHRWPAEVRTAIRNHGGGTYNHNLFWQMLSKTGGGEPKGEVLGAIDKSFGGFSKFKEEFTKTALGQFGSGWAWLLWNGSKLEVKGMPNQDAPVLPGQTALLGIDVWEHAYYLKYQNRRADYINAFYNVVNWDFVQARLAAAKA